MITISILSVCRFHLNGMVHLKQRRTIHHYQLTQGETRSEKWTRGTTTVVFDCVAPIVQSAFDDRYVYMHITRITSDTFCSSTGQKWHSNRHCSSTTSIRVSQYYVLYDWFNTVWQTNKGALERGLFIHSTEWMEYWILGSANVTDSG